MVSVRSATPILQTQPKHCQHSMRQAKDLWLQDKIDAHAPGLTARRVCDRIGMFKRCLFDLGLVASYPLSGKYTNKGSKKRDSQLYRSYYGILWIMSFRFETLFGH